jgi:DNA-binding protein HU-beta
MNRSDIVKIVANQTKFSQAKVNEIILLMIDAIALSLECGEEVTIQGLGKFSLKERKAVKKKHPKTGEEISVPRKRTFVFTPAKTLKSKLTTDLQETHKEAESIYYGEETWQPERQDRQTTLTSVPMEVQG